MTLILDINPANSNLSIVADWLSIIGFIISILTFGYSIIINNKVKSIQNRVDFNLHIDRNLNEWVLSQSKYLSAANKKSILDVRHEIRQIEGILSIILGLIGKDTDEVVSIIRGLNSQAKKIREGDIDMNKVQKTNPKWKFWLPNEILTTEIYDYYSQLVSGHRRVEQYAEKRKINLI